MTTLLTAFGFVVVVVLVGCGGERDVSPEARATSRALVIAEALGSAEAERELERREEALGDSVRPPVFGFASGITPRLTAIERMRDDASDRLFQKTPFHRAVDELPFRQPPLRVRQWVLTDRSPRIQTRAQRERFFRMSERAQALLLEPKLEHKLYARVDEDQFYGMSARAREAAVKEFYRDAEQLFR